jgi:hypothetical protein
MRLMTGREAVAELSDLIEGKANTLVTYDAGQRNVSIERARLDRMRFLIDYIHGKLPADTDHGGCC